MRDMTANEIAEEMARLRKLQRSGEITPRQGNRLRALEIEYAKCQPRERRGYWL